MSDKFIHVFLWILGSETTFSQIKRWCTASPDTILKLDTLVMIQIKFGFNWSGSFSVEDFLKSLQRTTDDDGCQKMISTARSTYPAILK
jgi:hypothetical protein